MSEAEITPSLQLNTRGLRCPEPVMMLHQAIRKSKAGDVVEVFATDNSTSWDIPKFCMHLGHELLLQEERLDENGNKEFHYLVKKGD
ncbi:sulfurtransferase TusA [Acinetobacter variabilis]|uniref:sulfurtransferase TusA n=1 Tax=Acinetobacter variabilis TaxID=70346 RepID=UPI0030F62A97